jgi:hypothetical protein
VDLAGPSLPLVMLKEFGILLLVCDDNLRNLAGHKLVGLSEEQIVSCSTTDYGCEGGWPFWALTDMLASPYSGRLDTEKGYPVIPCNSFSKVCSTPAEMVIMEFATSRPTILELLSSHTRATVPKALPLVLKPTCNNF